MKKYIFSFICLFIFLLFPSLNINAVSSNRVDYTIKDYFVQSDIDIAGSLNVKELIVLDGTFNGYIRDIKWKNEKLKEFTGKEEDFYGSDIYNATAITNLKVGRVNLGDEIEFNDMFNKVTYFEEGKNLKNGTKGKYEYTKNENEASIKIFDESEDKIVGFYLEYTVPNVAVKHNDVAEFYYNFIGEDFDDKIQNVEVRTFFPDAASDDYKVWAHGPLNGTINKIEGNLGSVLKCTNLPANTPVDVRMTYDLDLFPISINKNTNIDALDKIMKVEKERADTANAKRNAASLAVNILVITSIVYIVLLLVIGVFIYFKYDKELKSKFKNKYYREIIKDYPVEVVEYLMNGRISKNSLTASILNLIEKKKIEVVETKNKKDYILKLVNEKGLSKSEEKLVSLLFEVYGKNKQVSTSTLKKTQKDPMKISVAYNDWENEVLATAYKQNFYFDENKFKMVGVMYGIIGFILFILNLALKINSIIPIIAFIVTIIFIIYIFTLKKRTYKGNEDYHKWKAFKNFLKDFGRFEEKELPEIKLWGKYLVYASVFGIADEVRKSMKIKLEQINPNYVNLYPDTMFNYLLLTNFTTNINTSAGNVLSQSQIANTTYSSGSGVGGGFSSGGGFGGGGGGGRGF